MRTRTHKLPTALRRARLGAADGSAERLHALEILYEVACGILSARNQDELLARVLHTLCAVVSAQAASVWLLDDDGQMRRVASFSANATEWAWRERLPMECCLSGKPAVGNDVLIEDGPDPCAGPLLPGLIRIAVPLRYGGSTLGVYHLYSDDHALATHSGTAELLASIGRHLGVTMERYRREREARDQMLRQERRRLAHELHDSLAQTLASLRFQVRVLDETLQQSGDFSAISELEKVEHSLEQANLELRELIGHFRGPLAPQGLVPAVEDLVQSLREETGISVFLHKNDWRGDDLPTHMQLHVLRIIQESLANIRKHGHAHITRILLRSESADSHTVLIEDDGVGMGEPLPEARPGEHIGLSIMRERARYLGGALRIESEPGEGTRIFLEFSYHEAEQQARHAGRH